MAKLSDEDIDRIANALARKLGPQPHWNVLPPHVWVAPQPYYGPFRVTSGTTTTTTNPLSWNAWSDWESREDAVYDKP